MANIKKETILSRGRRQNYFVKTDVHFVQQAQFLRKKALHLHKVGGLA